MCLLFHLKAMTRHLMVTMMPIPTQTQTKSEEVRCFVKTYRPIVPIAICAFFVAFLITGARSVTAEGEANGGTIPPLKPFKQAVMTMSGSSNDAFSGELVTYTIALNNTSIVSTEVGYTARVGVTSTLPADVEVITTTIDPSEGDVEVLDLEQKLSWTLTVTYSNIYTLTYAVRAPETVTKTISLTSTAELYEIENLNYPYTPTSLTLTDTSVITVYPWRLMMPLLQRAKPPLPALANFNFEGGQIGWTQLVDSQPGKLIYSTQDRARVLVDDVYYAWLGGAANQENELKQEIELPRDYDDLRLRYLYWAASEEDDNSCGSDVAKVYFDGAASNPLKNYDLCTKTNTFNPAKQHGWTREIIDVASYKGQTVTLSFYTKLNGQKNSNFFVDVVQLCSDDTDAPAGTVKCTDPPTP